MLPALAAAIPSAVSCFYDSTVFFQRSGPFRAHTDVDIFLSVSYFGISMVPAARSTYPEPNSSAVQLTYRDDLMISKWAGMRLAITRKRLLDDICLNLRYLGH